MTGKYMHCFVLSTLLLAGCGSDASQGTGASDDGKTCAEGCVNCDNGVCLDKDNINKECPASCKQCDDDGKCLDQKEDDTNKNDPAVCTPACEDNQICQNGSCVGDTANHACAKCDKGQTCVNATCVSVDDACAKCGDATKCVGGICYDKDTMVHTGCLNCREDQVCRNNRCFEPTSFCATCAPNERCDGAKCIPLDDPCLGCSAEESCIDNACVPCETTMCSGVCCAEGEGCDLYSGICMPISETTGKPPCDGFYCSDDSVCTEQGKCERQCLDGRKACSTAQICCKDGYECYNDSYCRVACDETQTMCGEAKHEVCCAQGLVCYENGCHIACDETQGTRCGTNYEFCCDNATEVCVYGKCLTPTSPDTCETENDCDIWSVCDATTKRCVSALEVEEPCTYQPPVGEFEPAVKWHYQDNVVATPIVINLTDDNGDGVIDEKDIPEVVFVNSSKYLKALDGKTGKLHAASSNRIFNQHNDIAAANIDNDDEIEVVVPSSQQSKNYLYAMVLRPTVKDGVTTYKWVEKYRSPEMTSLSEGWADVHPTIADVNADGVPDIVTTRGVIRGNDWSKFQCTLKIANWSTWYHNFFALADLDQDGKMEVIDTDIYDASTTGGGACQVLISHTNAAQSMKLDGTAAKEDYRYTAVADLIEDYNDPAHPGELKPEIVRVRNGYVSVWKVYKTVVDGKPVWKQRRIWETQQTSTGGGNPVIADFDGDGQRDIGVAGKYHYAVFNGQTGQIVWASKTIDASSYSTGSSVFDFEGDGIAEVVYRDETRIRIYSGQGAGYDEDGKVIDTDKDGYMDAKVLWWWPNTSGTVIEYPLIVDVDNDGRTEIVMVSQPQNQYGTLGNSSYQGPEWTNLPTGIDVYRDTSDNWVRTRRIWNQHAYHVTNINEDGSVPVHEEPNWLNPHLNNYRMNVQPLVNFAPNFVPAGLEHTSDHCSDKAKNVEMTLFVRNKGSLGVSDKVGVSIYVDNYVYEGVPRRIFIGTAYTNQSISAGATVSVNFSWNRTGTVVIEGVEHTVTNMNPDNAEIIYVVDDAAGNSEYVAYNECLENDNTSTSTKLVECETIIY